MLGEMDMNPIRSCLLCEQIQVIVQVSDCMQSDLSAAFAPFLPMTMLLRGHFLAIAQSFGRETYSLAQKIII
ncbi:hypothetical protein D3C85_1806540 [compost metagenome]